ncbi:type III CRISPR-associated RAMP protein Csx7 [Calothrix sp. NIES-2098]|uniref:type III CRISPR-associated RAMP protein Csx7 n=1 Tax=Calothrix sp. NIES-2098 TaxID=1954171 RepID=UPI000B5F2740|nr:SSO1426 family CRISPR-associated RAMP protein [Calothrix sp. NIES-2098]
MFDVFRNRLEITGTLTTVTALRISAGRSTEPIGADLPVIKDALGRPLIPGASFKGALRSRLESFLRGIDPKFAANPALESEWSIPPDRMSEFKNSINNLANQAKEEQLHQFILDRTDLVSFLFGSPWLASKFQVRDLTVLPDSWFGQYQERDGVAIERDTETAGDGKLYDFQVVPAGTPFEFRAVVENAEPHELGLLMIGLHQFETEQIPLGGGRSRGLGVVKLDINKMWWFEYPDNNPEQLLIYLQRLVNGEKDHYKCNQEQLESHKQNWTKALIDYLRANINHSSPTATEQIT